MLGFGEHVVLSAFAAEEICGRGGAEGYGTAAVAAEDDQVEKVGLLVLGFGFWWSVAVDLALVWVWEGVCDGVKDALCEWAGEIAGVVDGDGASGGEEGS